MPEKRHVVPNPNGGWDVKKPGAQRVSSHHGTQGEAEQRAKAILQNAGGGEAVIHDRQGQIRDSDTVPPAKDPLPPGTRGIRRMLNLPSSQVVELLPEELGPIVLSDLLQTGERVELPQ